MISYLCVVTYEGSPINEDMPAKRVWEAMITPGLIMVPSPRVLVREIRAVG
jgi:hypothetical protein